MCLALVILYKEYLIIINDEIKKKLYTIIKRLIQVGIIVVEPVLLVSGFPDPLAAITESFGVDSEVNDVANDVALWLLVGDIASHLEINLKLRWQLLKD